MVTSPSSSHSCPGGLSGVPHQHSLLTLARNCFSNIFLNLFSLNSDEITIDSRLLSAEAYPPETRPNPYPKHGELHSVGSLDEPLRFDLQQAKLQRLLY